MSLKRKVLWQFVLILIIEWYSGYQLYGQYLFPTLPDGQNFIGGASFATNVNNKDGTRVQDLKKATGMLLSRNTGYCTCTLMNNTAHDGSLLLLTAAHCLSEEQINSEVGLVISFDYELADSDAVGDDLEDVNIRRAYIISGQLLMLDVATDIALIKLRREPSDLWAQNLYAAGWNASMTSEFQSNISHPMNDHKKVFFNPDYNELAEVRFPVENQMQEGYFFLTSGQWNGVDVRLPAGTSGSSYFDKSGKVIAVMSSSSLQIDYASAIANNWISSNASASIRPLLDPSGQWVTSMPGGYINDLIEVNEDFTLSIEPFQSFRTKGLAGDGTIFLNELIFLRPRVLLDHLEGNNNLIQRYVLGIKPEQVGSATVELTVHAIVPNPISNAVQQKLIYGCFVSHDTQFNDLSFGAEVWDYESPPEGILDDRSNDADWWPFRDAPGSSDSFSEAIVRAFVQQARRDGGVQSISDARIPVVITLSNKGSERVDVQAVGYPGDVPRNALQLFQPDDFAEKFKSYKYRPSRGNDSHGLYINGLSYSVDEVDWTNISTGDNGGYLNLVNQNYKIGPIKLSARDFLRNNLTLRLDVEAAHPAFNYKVWIDYFNTSNLNGITIDPEDPTQSHTYNFVNDPEVHQQEEIASGSATDNSITIEATLPTPLEIDLSPGQIRSTRMRVAISPETISQDGEYGVGEVEDYMIDLVAPTADEVRQAIVSASKIHLKGNQAGTIPSSCTDPEGQEEFLEDSAHPETCHFVAGPCTLLSTCNGIFDDDNVMEGDYAINFTGTEDKVVLDAGGLVLNGSFAERTVSFWINPATLSGKEEVFDEGGLLNGLAIRLNGFRVELGIVIDGSLKIIQSENNISANQWYHVAGVFDEGEIRLYINGTLAASDATFSQSDVVIMPQHGDGAAWGGTNNTNAFGELMDDFNGSADELLVFDEALDLGSISLLASVPINSRIKTDSPGREDSKGVTSAFEDTKEWLAFPNPANDKLHMLIDAENGGPLDIDILDMTGRNVYAKTLHDVPEGVQLVTINNLDLRSGQYILVVRILGRELKRERIVIVK